jgi:hypothetical protein
MMCHLSVPCLQYCRNSAFTLAVRLPLTRQRHGNRPGESVEDPLHPVPATLMWSAVLLVVFAALSVHRYVTAGT